VGRVSERATREAIAPPLRHPRRARPRGPAGITSGTRRPPGRHARPHSVGVEGWGERGTPWARRGRPRRPSAESNCLGGACVTSAHALPRAPHQFQTRRTPGCTAARFGGFSTAGEGWRRGAPAGGGSRVTARRGPSDLRGRGAQPGASTGEREHGHTLSDTHALPACAQGMCCVCVRVRGDGVSDSRTFQQRDGAPGHREAGMGGPSPLPRSLTRLRSLGDRDQADPGASGGVSML